MNIDRIRANVVGDYGLSSSNKYHVAFKLPSTEGRPGVESLENYIKSQTKNSVSLSNLSGLDPSVFDTNSTTKTDSGMVLSYLADEVNIPGYSIATGEFKGFRPGINSRYPHTRNFNECSIAFLQDMKHIPLKFIRYWADYIFGFNFTNVNNLAPYGLMNYYDDYTCDIIIDKLEPNTNNKTKATAFSSYDTHNIVTRTILKKAYPYLSNDFTVSNSPNQPVRVGITFFYEHMETKEFEFDKRKLEQPYDFSINKLEKDYGTTNPFYGGFA